MGNVLGSDSSPSLRLGLLSDEEKEVQSSCRLAMKNVTISGRCLQPHQIEMVEFIAARCNKKKGAVIYQKMGSGKTLATTVLLMNYYLRKIVFVTPSGLEENWRAEVRKMEPPLDKVTYLTYESFRSLLDEDESELARLIGDAVVVFDEAHYLLPIWNSTQSITLTHLLVSYPFKSLFLSGTIFYQRYSDIAYFLNVAMGSSNEAIPTQPAPFMDIYGYHNKAFTMQQWLSPVNALLMALFFIPSIGSLSNLMQQFRVVDRPNEVNIAVPQIQQFLTMEYMNTLVEQMLLKPKLATLLQNMSAFWKKYDTSFVTELFTTVRRKRTDAVKFFMHLLQSFNTQGVEIKVGTSISVVNSELLMFDLLTLPMILVALAAILSLVYWKVTKPPQLNVKKLYGDVKDIITFFDPEKDADTMLRFPKKSVVLEPVTMTKEQLEFYIRMIYGDGRLTTAELIYMGLSAQPTTDQVHTYGGMLGNYTYEGRDFVARCMQSKSKRLGCLEKNRGNGSWMFTAPPTTNGFKYFECPKFQMVAAEIERNPNVLVYSSFENATSMLSIYLNSRGIEHVYLDADPDYRGEGGFDLWLSMAMDASRNRRVVLLHPSLKEGLSFNGFLLLVLDPIANPSDEAQVYARVTRMLPQSVASDAERPVARIKQYYLTVPSFAAFLNSMTSWWQNSRHQWFFQRDAKIALFSTPDELVLKSNALYRDDLDKIETLLRANTGSACAKQCDIYTGPNSLGTCNPDIGNKITASEEDDDFREQPSSYQPFMSREQML